MTARFLFLPLLLLLAVLPAPVATAQDGLSTVRVDGRTLFRVGPVDTLSAPDRAAQIERRVQRVLAQPGAVGSVERERRGERVALRVGEQAIMEVTPEDADERLMTVGSLAVDWAGRIDDALERGRRERGSRVGGVVLDIGAALSSAFGRMAESAVTVVPRVLAATLVLLLFWAIAAAVRGLLALIVPRIVRDETTQNLVKQVPYYAVWTLGFLVALGALGFAPEAAFAGLGLTSLALGFALKDILSNFVSGLLILALRPFRIGDQIVVGDMEGDVERIELRATQIRTYDGRVVLIPNDELFTSRLTNNTAAPVRRNRVEVWFGYGEPLGRAAEVLIEAASTTAGVLPEPPPSVRIRELTSAAIRAEVRFWTDSRRSDYVATASLVRKHAVEALRSAGIGLPNPSALRVQLDENETPAPRGDGGTPVPPPTGRGEAALRADEDAKLPPHAGLVPPRE